MQPSHQAAQQPGSRLVQSNTAQRNTISYSRDPGAAHSTTYCIGGRLCCVAAATVASAEWQMACGKWISLLPKANNAIRNNNTAPTSTMCAWPNSSICQWLFGLSQIFDLTAKKAFRKIALEKRNFQENKVAYWPDTSVDTESSKTKRAVSSWVGW